MSILIHDPKARDYVLNRFDRAHIADLAEMAKVKLAKGEAVQLCYMPGDATWYALIIAPVWTIISAPSTGATDGQPHDFLGGAKYVIVYAQQNQAVWCNFNDEMEWVASKFDCTEASQLAIAEMLKAVFSQ